MNCHEACLKSALRIVNEKGKNIFELNEIVSDLKEIGFNESTVRTHITSRCCAGANEHHAKTYSYFNKVGKGLYKINDKYLTDNKILQ